MNGVIDFAARYFLLDQASSLPRMPCLGVRTNSVSRPNSASSTARVWFTHRPMPSDITSGSRLITAPRDTRALARGVRSRAISRCEAR